MRETVISAPSRALSRRALLRFGHPPPARQDRVALIDQACLAARGIACRSCEDVCEPQALRFRPRIGGLSAPEVDPLACTGCGECVSVCPAGAVTVCPEEEL